MNKAPMDSERIEAEAARWLARRDGGLDSGQRAAFERWRAADARHAAIFGEIEAAWSMLDRPRDHGRAGQLRGELVRRARRRLQRRIALGAVAAMTVIAAVLILPFSGSVRPAPGAVASAVRVIAPEQQILPDGSITRLPAGSRIAVDFTPAMRRVRLLRGQAHFEVQKDSARPFVVIAGAVEVRAVGTAFAVTLAADEVEVLVTEGRVAVEAGDAEAARRPAAEPALVTAGTALVVPIAAAPAAVPLTPQDIERRLAWRWERIEFTDTTIAEAAALFNRRKGARLQIGDDAVAAMRVTGVFRADNAEGFVNLLESGFGIRVERRAGGELVLHTSR